MADDGGFVSNFDSATRDLGLTPQEQNLYQHHLNNLTGSGRVDNSDGSTSTIYQSVQERNGRYYNVPTVWNGQILSEKDPSTGIPVPNKQAMQNIDKAGWDNFPSYATPDEADARYHQIHEYMGEDTQRYNDMMRANMPGSVNDLSKRGMISPRQYQLLQQKSMAQ